MFRSVSILLALLLTFQSTLLMAGSKMRNEELFVHIYTMNFEQTYGEALTKLEKAFSVESLALVKNDLATKGLPLDSTLPKPVYERGRIVLHKSDTRKIHLISETTGLAANDGKEYWRYEAKKPLDENYFALLKYLNGKSLATNDRPLKLSDFFVSSAYASEKEAKELQKASNLKKTGATTAAAGVALMLLELVTAAVSAPALGTALMVTAPIALIVGFATYLIGKKNVEKLTDPLFQCDESNQITFVFDGKRVPINDEKIKKALLERAPELSTHFDIVSSLVAKSNKDICGPFGENYRPGLKEENLHSINKEYLRLYGKTGIPAEVKTYEKSSHP